MASTYSTSLKLELIGNGDQSGTWGTTTNTNLGTLLEQAITGVQTITMANANVTLTSLNGASDEARNAVLVVGGTNSAIRNIIAPAVNKTYIVVNNTVGGFAILIKTSASTGLSIPNGATQLVYCDGSEFYLAGPNITTATANTPNTVVLRDGSGNFAAGTITASLTGNVTGNVTGNASGTAAGLSATLAVGSGGTGITSAGTNGNVLTSNGSAWVSSAPASQGFASGTRMSFNQTSAPTGWTKDTTSAINDSILRLVTGSVSSGGSTGFSTFNAQTSTGAFTLSISEIPSHTHTVGAGTNFGSGISSQSLGTFANTTSSTGGGGSHSHSLTHNVKYYDFIIASKD
jgi:hypothetical protein